MGITPWDLMKREHPEVPLASAAAVEGGEAIRSGVPSFDSTITILRP